MAKAAKVKIRVSTQPVVVMEAEVARKIRQHARTSMKAEVCGVLIGSTEHERMMVEACIPGNNAAQGGAHVTFTQDTWEHIYKIKDKEFPDHKIVGWYHSHPGFGVFLSEHDLFIQQNFFSNPQQVAWVYDPHTDEEGCFGWVGEKIEKLTAIRVGYSQNIEVSASGVNDYEDEDAALDSMVKVRRQGEPEEPAWVRWTSMGLGYLAAPTLIARARCSCSAGAASRARTSSAGCASSKECASHSAASLAAGEDSRAKRKRWQTLTTNRR